MQNVKVKVVETKGTGFLPDMGTLKATKVLDEHDVAMYQIADDKAGSQNGTHLTATQVEEVA